MELFSLKAVGSRFWNRFPYSHFKHKFKWTLLLRYLHLSVPLYNRGKATQWLWLDGLTGLAPMSRLRTFLNVSSSRSNHTAFFHILSYFFYYFRILCSRRRPQRSSAPTPNLHTRNIWLSTMVWHKAAGWKVPGFLDAEIGNAARWSRTLGLQLILAAASRSLHMLTSSLSGQGLGQLCLWNALKMRTFKYSCLDRLHCPGTMCRRRQIS